jgi:hypothetical protein
MPIINSKHPLYKKWHILRASKRNKKSILCDVWRYDCKSFFDWSFAHEWRKGARLIKKDEEKEHSPSNSYWIPSLKEVLNNQTSTLNRDISTCERNKIIKELHQYIPPVMIAVKRAIPLRAIKEIDNKRKRIA